MKFYRKIQHVFVALLGYTRERTVNCLKFLVKSRWMAANVERITVDWSARAGLHIALILLLRLQGVLDEDMPTIPYLQDIATESNSRRSDARAIWDNGSNRLLVKNDFAVAGINILPFCVQKCAGKVSCVRKD